MTTAGAEGEGEGEGEGESEGEGVGEGGGEGEGEGEGEGDGDVLQITLELVADGLTAPVFLTHAGDGSGRLFIVDQAGQIRVVTQDGTLLAEPFLFGRQLFHRLPFLNAALDASARHPGT